MNSQTILTSILSTQTQHNISTIQHRAIMTSSIMLSILKKLCASSSLMLMVACTTHQSAVETVQICNSGGCVDRPRGYTAPDSPTTVTAEKNPQIEALQTLAVEDPSAAHDLALRFFRGDGVRQDSYQAIKWMRDAAERGHLKAQMALGRLYLTGLSEMGADPGEAERWLSIKSLASKFLQRLVSELFVQLVLGSKSLDSCATSSIEPCSLSRCSPMNYSKMHLFAKISRCNVVVFIDELIILYFQRRYHLIFREKITNDSQYEFKESHCYSN